MKDKFEAMEAVASAREERCTLLGKEMEEVKLRETALLKEAQEASKEAPADT